MLSVTLAVHGGREKKSDTALPGRKVLAARVSGLHSEDSRESLRCKIRALALLKLCSRELIRQQQQNQRSSQTWWHGPIILATLEVEAGGSLEHRNLCLA